MYTEVLADMRTHSRRRKRKVGGSTHRKKGVATPRPWWCACRSPLTFASSCGSTSWTFRPRPKRTRSRALARSVRRNVSPIKTRVRRSSDDTLPSDRTPFHRRSTSARDMRPPDTRYSRPRQGARLETHAPVLFVNGPLAPNRFPNARRSARNLSNPFATVASRRSMRSFKARVSSVMVLVCNTGVRPLYPRRLARCNTLVPDRG